MRFLIALLMAVALAAPAAMGVPLVADSSYVAAEQQPPPSEQQQPQPSGQQSPPSQQQPSGRVEVDINTDSGGGAWWVSPIWIGIGAVALLALIAIIVAASRGGTTVVKD